MYIRTNRGGISMHLAAVAALSASLVACETQEGEGIDAGGVDASELGSQKTPWEPAGLPSFHKAPFARSNPDGSAAKLASGYHYAYGQLDDVTSYSIYTYIDSAWTYMSSYIWGNDGSSIGSGMSTSSYGDAWYQASSSEVLEDGSMAGTYFTTYVDGNGMSTVYNSDYAYDGLSSTYRSTSDAGNTVASPDCDYYSTWSGSSSTGYSTCARPDESWWYCSYEYSYNYDESSSAYESEEVCNDSRTEASPDYSYVSSSMYDYGTGAYESTAEVSCYDTEGNPLAYTYLQDNTGGHWYDASGIEVSYPSCTFSYY